MISLKLSLSSAPEFFPFHARSFLWSAKRENRLELFKKVQLTT